MRYWILLCLSLGAVALLLLGRDAGVVNAAARPPLEWDARLDDLNVTYQPATDCRQGCYRLTLARFEDVDESGGNHNVYARLRDQNNVPQIDAPWHVTHAGGDNRVLTKAKPDWSDVSIWSCYNPDQGAGGYRAYAGDDPARSDQVHGMGLPQCQHVNFRLVWQWSTGGTPTPTAPPTMTPFATASGMSYAENIPMVYGGKPEDAPPTATLLPNSTPTHTPLPTATHTPSATATPNASPYSGEIVQTFPNCGLTQLFGVVHDANGTPLPGTRLRLTWQGNATPLYAVAGAYVRPETDASGWDFVLANSAVAGAWRVAVVDSTGAPLSAEVVVNTVSSCAATDLNVAKIRFQAQ